MALISTRKTTNLEWSAATFEQKMSFAGAVALTLASILSEGHAIVFEYQAPQSLKMLGGLVVAIVDGFDRMGPDWQLLTVTLGTNQGFVVCPLVMQKLPGRLEIFFLEAQP